MSRYSHLNKEELIRLLDRREHDTSYGLVWERNDIAPDDAVNEDFVILDPDLESSVGDGPFRDMIIEGDNYDALRFLRMTFAGRVKCIYIDPPYNTGNRDFIYNDHFADATHRFRHSTWLEFMYRRLVLARDLLHPEGAIFVSIDDNELFQLGMLMNRVFGEKNFVANIIWQKVFSPKNSARHFSVDHDYILAYAADANKWAPNPLPRTERQDKAYKNPDDDPRGPWMSSDLSARNYYGEGTYSIITPKGRVIDGPPPGTYWRVSKDKFSELDRKNRIWWGTKGNNQPRLKRFLSEVKDGRVPQTFWPYSEVGHTQEAKKEILDILEFENSAAVFSTPKPTRLIERILRLATGPDDIALDFFAGSGTTAHAVLKLNREDGGRRRFILVSNTEATAENPGKNICKDICAARVRGAITGYTKTKGDAVAGLGGDFLYLRTKTLPRHRLVLKLSDPDIWHILQMMHDLPVAPWADGWKYACGENEETLICYAAKVTSAVLDALGDRIQTAGQKDIVIYSWAPDLIRRHFPHAAAEPIPEAIEKRYRS